MARAQSNGGTLDFFGAQEQAHRRSGWLILYFILATVLIVAAVYLLVSAAIIFSLAVGDSSVHGRLLPWWDLERFAWVGGITVVVIVVAAWSKLLEYNQGGGAVARSLGGRKVDATTRQPAERRLLNIVEEMALAAGVPVPEVYVLDSEAGINAFAAGNTLENAAVAVTQGALENLTRDELQGVIGHEFSHILNGDMRLNLRLGGMLFGIMALSIVAGGLMRSFFASPRVRTSSRREGGGSGNAGSIILVLVVVAVGVYLIGQIGSFFGHLIQAAVSRQREFLADASAVQFTRNPEGIAGALKKIGGVSKRGKMAESKASSMAHLFFANALDAQLIGLMATHPPLKERILRIDPGWDGKFTSVEQTGSPDVQLPPPPSSQRFIPPEHLILAAGAINQASVAYAQGVRRDLPKALQAVGEDPVLSRLAVLALMVDRQPGRQREEQLQWLEMRHPDDVYALRETLEAVDHLPRRDHLTVLELASAALRQSTEAEAASLREALQGLAETDRRVDLREWCVLTIALRRLERDPAPGKVVTEIEPVAGAMSRVLSRVVEAEPSGDHAAVFQASLKGLYLQKYLQFEPVDPQETVLLSHDLEALRPCSPPMKRAFLQACGRAISQDGQITEVEAELFRALAIGLGVPVPPVIVQ